MPSPGRAIIAAAGSGKTQRLIGEAFADPSQRVLITTYTRENLREIESRVWEAGVGAEHGVTVMSWYAFLLRDGVKPYQAYKTEIGRIRSINFIVRRQQSMRRYVPRANFDAYYLDSDSNVYQDVVSDLVCVLDDESSGKVIARLAACYDAIYVDEMQDLAGYDLDLLERLLSAGVPLLVVGDPRQAVYSTNSSPRYKQYRRSDVVGWIEGRERAGQLDVEALTECHRCNQAICDFADALYSDLPKTTSTNGAVVDDMGVYLLDPADLDAYRKVYSPQELRWSKTVPVESETVLNFGQVKGACFDRVVIHATKPMTDYLASGAELADEARAKFYVAATRARHSVAIVPKRRVTGGSLPYWTPPLAAIADQQRSNNEAEGEQ